MINQNIYPFRRNTTISPYMVPATNTASQVLIGPLPEGVRSFAMVNAFPVFMRLVGSSQESGFIPAADWTGWLIPPYHFGIYSTQYPKWVSAIAVDRPGYPIMNGQSLLYPTAVLELFYGAGA